MRSQPWWSEHGERKSRSSLMLESQLMLGACVTIVDCNFSSLSTFNSIGKSITQVWQEMFLNQICSQQQPANLLD
ncbi:hypothetical protein ACE6H2_023748 [Prunus campanulata]